MKWRDLVESDRIQQGDRWYVVQSVSPDGPDMRVRAKSELSGKVSQVIKPADAEVKAERGVTGDVVDLFRVIFSGPTRPVEIITKGVGPMLGEREEDE